jgi:hypothetical protein
VPSNSLFASSLVGIIDNDNYSSQLLNTVNSFSTSTSTIPYIFWNVQNPYNPIVTDEELLGFLWGPLTGYISLNCRNTSSCDSALFKVKNDGKGKLSGYAWGENTGWISFSCANSESSNCASNGNASTSINEKGEFTGYAWTQNFGWIVFDCSKTETCVKTDWRPASIRNINTNNIISNGNKKGIDIILPVVPDAKAVPTDTKNIDMPCKGASCLTLKVADVFPEITKGPNTDIKTSVDTPTITSSGTSDSGTSLQTNELVKNVYVQQVYGGTGEVLGTVSVKSLSTQSKGDTTIYISKVVTQEEDVSSINTIKSLPLPQPASSTTKKAPSIQKKQNTINTDKKHVIYEISAVRINGREAHTFASGLAITLPVPKEFATAKLIAISTKERGQKNWKLITITEYKPTVSFSINHLSLFKIEVADDMKTWNTNKIILIILSTFALLVIWYTRRIIKNYGNK